MLAMFADDKLDNAHKIFSKLCKDIVNSLRMVNKFRKLIKDKGNTINLYNSFTGMQESGECEGLKKKMRDVIRALSCVTREVSFTEKFPRRIRIYQRSSPIKDGNVPWQRKP